MPEYLPLKAPGQDLTFTASAAITGGQLVRISGANTVAPTTAASADWIGVAANDAVSGAALTVFTGGVQRLVASGTIAAAALVEGAAAGAVANNATFGANTVGIALSPATNGNFVNVQLIRG